MSAADQPSYDMPGKEDLKPLLKAARKCSGRHFDRERAVALYDKDGNLAGGPKIITTGRIDWANSGVEVSASGPFTSYDDLRESWRRKVANTHR